MHVSLPVLDWTVLFVKLSDFWHLGFGVAIKKLIFANLRIIVDSSRQCEYLKRFLSGSTVKFYI